jgi:hypothetical protein
MEYDDDDELKDAKEEYFSIKFDTNILCTLGD